MPGPPKAILFDVDGVLLDSIAAHRHAWGAWATLHDLDVELVWAATFGRRSQDTMALTAPALDRGEQLLVLDGLVAAHEHEIHAYAGAGELLRGLAATPWALVTSGTRVLTTARFRRLRLPLPRVIVCAEDVRHGKPDPECYLGAINQLGVRAGDCIVVEDAPAGVTAGHAAGCRVIAVTSTHPASALGHADEILDDLEQVDARLTQLLG